MWHPSIILMTDKIICAHILVEKYTVAQQILERLKKGEDFSKLARLH